MRTSAIAHQVSSSWGDLRNASADGKTCTMYPSDLTRFRIAMRTEASSSMTEITGMFFNRMRPDGRAEPACTASHSPLLRRGWESYEGLQAELTPCSCRK